MRLKQFLPCVAKTGAYRNGTATLSVDSRLQLCEVSILLEWWSHALTSAGKLCFLIYRERFCFGLPMSQVSVRSNNGRWPGAAAGRVVPTTWLLVVRDGDDP